MAVLVAKYPQRRYQSIGTIGISVSEQQKADRLDARLEKGIAGLVKLLTNRNLMPEKRGEGTLEAYWEVGRVLREVAESEDFEDMAELPLLWRNAKMYLCEELLYKDRGPYREHLWYCYRLGGYPKDLAIKMRWGEWVTIFDSSGINQEKRFDDWFSVTLAKQNGMVSRELIRMFAPFVNAMLGNIDIGDLSDVELCNCYEAAWHLSMMWGDKKNSATGGECERKGVQASISSKLGLLDGVMDGSMSSYEYAVTILDCPE